MIVLAGAVAVGFEVSSSQPRGPDPGLAALGPLLVGCVVALGTILVAFLGVVDVVRNRRGILLLVPSACLVGALAGAGRGEWYENHRYIGEMTIVFDDGERPLLGTPVSCESWGTSPAIESVWSGDPSLYLDASAPGGPITSMHSNFAIEFEVQVFAAARGSGLANRTGTVTWAADSRLGDRFAPGGTITWDCGEEQGR